MNSAWMAGLFEGEGCITGQFTRGDYFAPRLSLKMTDYDIVRRFAEMANCGHLREEETGHKPALRWTCTKRQDIRRLLSLMLPYFGIRRGHKALDYLDMLELDK